MMHFSTSDKNFEKSFFTVVSKSSLTQNVGISQIHPLTSDLIEEKTMIYSSFRK